MKLKKHNFFLISSLFIIISLVFCNAAIAGTPTKVLILPFSIHSEKDLSFLRDGIEDMLSTRLAQEGEIIPISREETHQAIKTLSKPVNTKIAISLGKKFQADYVLYGSLTVFGESISTDAKFLDIRKNKNIATFYEVGKNNSDVIFHINRFAGQINEKIFGRKAEDLSGEPPKRKADDSRKHPDSLWAEKKRAEPEPKRIKPNRIKKDSPRIPTPVPSSVPTASSPEIPRVSSQTTAAQVSKAPGTLWKSQNFNIQIKAMAVGDVDGDNRNEIVFTDEKNLFIYRYSDGKLEKLGITEGRASDTFLSIDIADVSQNGISEIFVTNVTRNNRTLMSFVLEWNGREFAKTEDKSKWYFRVINVPSRGNILIGQKRGIRKVFSKGIYELRWENGRYVAGTQQILPLWINVYSFAYGDVLNSGQDMIVAFAQNDHIRLLNMDGSEEWRSSKPFGGSSVYLEFPAEASSSIGNVRETSRRYLSQRIHIADTDKDGKNEVIVGNNKDTTRRILSKFRMYKSGQIECLAWDNVGLYQKWKTREISGHISDYAVGDIDNDGEDELVFSVVAKTSSILGKAKSFILSRDF